ncbi:hypothetical protein AJ79_00756 [Helicocarpus griseus UAMH5409]|uniref:Tryptophan dimethylallyltransferase n=1 Tax=Helicocarpus griseus UAMH5409 TaxID=1447875 RepID=A0A2B7YB29_9EURO|nr:hypothetical protein AJ79_00756 [Helicocarpus griseus UAMH5409]
MVNETVLLPSEAITKPHAENSATEYWSQHLRSLFAPLLKATGTYTESEQASHLQFLDEQIAPNLGPVPTEKTKYTTPSSLVGSPIDPSLNLTSSGKVKVRFDFDVIEPAEPSADDPFSEKVSRELYHHLASIVGADTRWLDGLMSALYLSPSETETALAKMPPGIAIPPSSVGFDLDGPKRTLKAYIPGVRKAFATGRPSSEVIFDALRGLEPLGSELTPGLNIIAEYLANCKNDAMLPLVGIDCVDPTKHKDARVKCYLHTSSNTFAVVRDVLTLGGRLNDETTLKRVEALRSIWPLLLNEPEGENIADDNWSKPQRFSKTGYSGMQYTMEITPGKPIPDSKVYIPLFQYAETPEIAEKNFESILTKLGHEWGSSGKYRDAMKEVFGGEFYGQTYATFTYTKERGAYMTSYFAKPIRFDEAGLPSKFGLRDE